MLAMAKKPVDLTHDIAYYTKDGRLTEPSDGKKYEWQNYYRSNAAVACPKDVPIEEVEKFRIK